MTAPGPLAKLSQCTIPMKSLAPSRLALDTIDEPRMELDLLQSKDEVSRLSPAIRDLATDTLHGHDITYMPDYFLPRVSKRRLPRVVVCYEQGRMVGVVYAEEQKVCGACTGWVYGGDEMGRGLVLASPEREAEVLATACEYLLQHGAHALRLIWRSTGNEILPILRLERPDLQVWCKSELREEGDWLHLASTYGAFLGRLGPHTRRNLRYYRRKTEAAGMHYVPELTLQQYQEAVVALNLVADFPSVSEREERDHRFFAQFGTPVLSGLADANGRLVSVLGAVRSGTHLHVLTQLNDESLRPFSISLVLRGYLIEQLIPRGFTSIHFVNGASPMLGRFCDPVLMRSISVDSRRSPLHPVKLATAHAARRWQSKGRRVPMRLRGLLGSYLAAF